MYTLKAILVGNYYITYTCTYSYTYKHCKHVIKHSIRYNNIAYRHKTECAYNMCLNNK